MAQLELLPSVASITTPDLWSVDRKVKGLGRIRALRIAAGTYEAKTCAVHTKEAGKLILTINSGTELQIAATRSKQLSPPYGVVGKIEEHSTISKWVNGPETIPNRETIVQSWAGNIMLKKGDRDKNLPGLRNAQLGGVHGLFSHWTLSDDPATIVMPTGTGKTETMLTIATYGLCSRILVVVPSDALRTQVGDKFCRMGILHAQEILGKHAIYPVVGFIETTPRTKEALKGALQ